MLISGFNFTRWSSSTSKLFSIHIGEGVQIVNGVNFNTLKTLSFGFYRRTLINSSPDNVYQLRTPYIPATHWSGDWYFGFNYRIRCQQDRWIIRNMLTPPEIKIRNDFPYDLENAL